MAKRNSRPLTPLGIWIKTRSLVKQIELRSIAHALGIWPQNLTDKMRGVRPFSDSEIAAIEKIFGESYSEHKSA